MKKTLVYIDHDLEFDYKQLVIINAEEDILNYEVNELGEDVLENFNLTHLPQGYYYADYNCQEEGEYCDGHLMYTYGILGDLVLTPVSWYESLFLFRHTWIFLIKQFFYSFLDIFRPVWRYDAYYGGAGLSYVGYFPKSLYYYIIKKDLGLGKPIKTELYKG